jgi:hypothetical protein
MFIGAGQEKTAVTARSFVIWERNSPRKDGMLLPRNFINVRSVWLRGPWGSNIR